MMTFCTLRKKVRAILFVTTCDICWVVNRLNVSLHCSSGGVDAGVHGRSADGRFFTILESPEYTDETSGLAFSPDAKQ
jgi:hypothetical protein